MPNSARAGSNKACKTVYCKSGSVSFEGCLWLVGNRMSWGNVKRKVIDNLGKKGFWFFYFGYKAFCSFALRGCFRSPFLSYWHFPSAHTWNLLQKRKDALVCLVGLCQHCLTSLGKASIWLLEYFTIKELKALIDKYLKKHDSISAQELYEKMGFPENWRKITRYRKQ